MRRLGTGTGFANAKLSKVLPRSERSLATVRMTDFSRAPFGQDDGLLSRCLLRSGLQTFRDDPWVTMTDFRLSPEERYPLASLQMFVFFGFCCVIIGGGLIF